MRDERKAKRQKETFINSTRVKIPFTGDAINLSYLFFIYLLLPMNTPSSSCSSILQVSSQKRFFCIYLSCASLWNSYSLLLCVYIHIITIISFVLVSCGSIRKIRFYANFREFLARARIQALLEDLFFLHHPTFGDLTRTHVASKRCISLYDKSFADLYRKIVYSSYIDELSFKLR